MPDRCSLAVMTAQRESGRLNIYVHSSAEYTSTARLRRCVAWFQVQIQEKLRQELDANRKLRVT
jgi:hypothetical protein